MEKIIVKKNLRFYIPIIIITLIMFVGCSNENNKKIDSKGDSLQTVVEYYFQYNNEKNKDKVLTTLTEHWSASNVVWGLENLDSIKIVKMEEQEDEKIKKGYLSNRRGSINWTSENNLKVYKVKYDVRYKKDGIGPRTVGYMIGGILL
ncbi:hypothetical protein HMPREF1982_03917 [Clostridiales bacterium oral taxon 876 str. F0540]|nr:hypothetical protein HMPREF1982_03917 [Clostridiales bacterium oral taxon 876 str. F0540]